MSEPSYDVVAVGNALVDVLAPVSEEFLQQQVHKYGMAKNAMTLIDEQRAVELYAQLNENATSDDLIVQTSGGSAANTMAGIASFGGKGAFIGKVAKDELGDIFKGDMKSQHIMHETYPLAVGAPTGRCMILVTPDGQRTMNTYLGASVELNANDIDEDIIASAKVTYLEGYLFDKEQAKMAFIAAADFAHEAGHRVALSLSDKFCVDRHRPDFLKLVENHVDILFANEEEIKALFQTETHAQARVDLSKNVEMACLTRGEKGAVVISKDGETLIEADHVEKVVDTTGAGDQFAAGFLYGFTHDMDPAQCGKLAVMAAAEVIQHIGPRPHTSLADLAKIVTS